MSRVNKGLLEIPIEVDLRYPHSCVVCLSVKESIYILLLPSYTQPAHHVESLISFVLEVFNTTKSVSILSFFIELVRGRRVTNRHI